MALSELDITIYVSFLSMIYSNNCRVKVTILLITLSCIDTMTSYQDTEHDEHNMVITGSSAITR